MFVVLVHLDNLGSFLVHRLNHYHVYKPLSSLHKSYYKSRCCKDYKFLLRRVGTQGSHRYKIHIFASSVNALLVVAQHSWL